jgi:hypothetical protein
MTVGLPGTGLSYSTKLSGKQQAPRRPFGCLKTALILCVLAYAGLFFIGAMLTKPTGTWTVLLLVLSFVVLLAWLRKRSRAKQQAQRWAHLTSNYGDEAAQRILNGELWQGCTTAMLKEILGEPHDIDTKILKTKSKYTYKYRPTGANGYGLRVFVEEDEVVGWEDK